MRQGFMSMLIKAGQEAVMKNKKKVAPREICDVLRGQQHAVQESGTRLKNIFSPF